MLLTITMCRQNLQYKCKDSHEVWIVCAVEFKSQNSNWRGSIAFLCLRFYCDVVVLHFKSHCVYNRRGSNLFLMILPWKSGSRILIYILHAVVWMPTDRERGNALFERRDINLGLLQCALPPKAGWQMPNPKLDAQLKLGQSKKNHFKCIPQCFLNLWHALRICQLSIG